MLQKQASIIRNSLINIKPDDEEGSLLVWRKSMKAIGSPGVAALAYYI